MIFEAIRRLGLPNILHWKLVAASRIDAVDGCNSLLTFMKGCASNVGSLPVRYELFGTMR